MGVVLAGMLSGGAISAAAAFTLALGIAIQNFPEELSFPCLWWDPG